MCTGFSSLRLYNLNLFIQLRYLKKRNLQFEKLENNLEKSGRVDKL